MSERNARQHEVPRRSRIPLVTSWLDWKLGGRVLVKYPGLSVIGGLTLAVAIGLGAVWFEVTRQIVSPRLPLDEGDRIVRIDNWDAAATSPESRLLHFQLWREQLTSIEEVGAFRLVERNLITPDGGSRPAAVAEISASGFTLARVPPLSGRTLIEADEAPGAADVVVIGYDIWQSRFDGADVIGRTVRLGRTPATIVGVMPEGFRFPIDHQLWVPLRMATALEREVRGLLVFGRLADGATLESAQAELTTIAQRVVATTSTPAARALPFVTPYGAAARRGYSADDSVGDEALMLRLSNLLAWLVLAAACANVATLMFARTATREAEIAVRNALGASRARVITQLFVEAFVLCAVAAVVGLTAASFALDWAVALMPLFEQDFQVPFWWQFSISPATIAYTGILAVGGAAMVSLLPAIKATGPRLQTQLANVASGRASLRFGPVWSAMIVIQVASATLCLPAATAAVFWTLRGHVERAPYPTHEYLTFRPELDPDVAFAAAGDPRTADARAQRLTVYEELKRQLENEPSVAAVTFGDGLPGMYHPLRRVEAQRGTDPPFVVDANIESDLVRTASVDIGYFDALGLPLIAGRSFQAGDVSARNAVMINETLARNIGGNPVGVRLRYVARRDGEETGAWYEVVGVVRGAGMEVPTADFIFMPVSAADVSPLVVGIHVRGDADALAPRLHALAAQVDPGLRLYELRTLAEVVRRNDLGEILAMLAVVAVTLLVVGLSAAGLYSLLSVAVTRHTREIGIRLAIGASPRAVLAAVFARAAMQVGAGIIVACVLLPPLMKAIGISELSVWFVLKSVSIAAAGMLLVGLVACGVPARRALRIQPTEAMRYVG